MGTNKVNDMRINMALPHCLRPVYLPQNLSRIAQRKLCTNVTTSKVSATSMSTSTEITVIFVFKRGKIKVFIEDKEKLLQQGYSEDKQPFEDSAISEWQGFRG